MAISWRRAKSPGWAAFDLKQRQKGLEVDIDPYPPISEAVVPPDSSHNSVKNHEIPARPFSSVFLPTVNSPTLPDNGDFKKPLLPGNSSTMHRNERIDVLQASKKLKELHSWADKSLLEDVLAALEYDVDKASASLKAMVVSANGNGYDPVCNRVSRCNKPTCRDDSLGDFVDLADVGCVLDGYNSFNNEKPTDNIDSHEKKHTDDVGHLKLILGRLASIPIEPEWEEDDIYYIHRKDAIKMMRLASQHFRAAKNAYLRGDHISAQQLSLNAQEEWMAAERLNAKAAKEILNIRNSGNNLWNLDLHGLHASEAVQALQERLQKLESQLLSIRSISPNETCNKIGAIRSTSPESLSYRKIEKMAELHASSSQRSTSLHVITGKGNHSRGQAAIPIAVRNFLSEHGYRYDETRPGVITVRPKIRCQRNMLEETGAIVIS